MAAVLLASAVLLPGNGAYASGGGSGGGDAAAGLNLVPMTEVDVPVVDSGLVSGVLHFKLVLQAANPEAAKRIEGTMPALRASAVAAGIEFARLEVSALRAVDAKALDAAMTQTLHKLDPGVSRVLVVEVSAHR
ncbi:MAG: hypothetical protein J7495_11405 [Sphingomonas sp.]|nr:hypothetical protein [Sphingomonas sp.]